MTQRASLVLAAGKGTRMKSDLAKVLHTIDGRALVEYVIDTAEGLKLHPNVVVVGHQADRVREGLKGRDGVCADQSEQLGTGDAVKTLRLKVGESFHCTPRTVHRMVAVTDVDVLEASTPDLDDVVRLEDAYGREGTSKA